jgi:hypothetical protein
VEPGFSLSEGIEEDKRVDMGCKMEYIVSLAAAAAREGL